VKLSASFRLTVGLPYFAALAIFIARSMANEHAISLTDAQAREIGMRIWKNECAGTIEGLTSWNRGENFASLGIGHFIWYPAGVTGPFEESFPKLLAYLRKNGVKLPDWISEAKGCPWPTREAFLADANSARMKELRALLAETIPLQARFAALRMEAALPKMLAAAPSESREKIRTNFFRVAREPMGLYALIDYVNFKGEGVACSERYNGQGWGLLQVLEGMGNGPALQEFSHSAIRVLTLRVQNSPPERNEARWLPGWKNRCASYAKEF